MRKQMLFEDMFAVVEIRPNVWEPTHWHIMRGSWAVEGSRVSYRSVAEALAHAAELGLVVGGVPPQIDPVDALV